MKLSLYLTLLLSIFCHCSPLVLREEMNRLQGGFDIFNLAMEKWIAPPPFNHLTRTDQWPYAACMKNGLAPCKQPIPNYFTLHGIWPSNIAPPHPSECLPASFDSNIIASLVPELSTAWPSLHKDNVQTWKHQWNKHGVCFHFTRFEYYNFF
ncbi:ribonuclease S-4-like [Lathyrus oleraceus]|uniref:ribonuclease S-4-like n=1 Tax=Pisum sativum TaxID=3888 RepID=UPI0021CE98C8|nr:ribonuclease S-4-like [Pisum sativum]